MKIHYTRLPGRSMGLASRGSIWLGPDHLLVVHETMMGEDYRRFFFRDLKSIVIRATPRRARTAVVLGALTLLNLLPLFALDAPTASRRGMAWLALGAVLWAGLGLANLLRGPTCETRLRTAVQDEVVPALGRRRAARRVAALLRPHVLAAQAGEAVPAAAGDPGPSPAAEGPAS